MSSMKSTRFASAAARLASSRLITGARGLSDGAGAFKGLSSQELTNVRDRAAKMSQTASRYQLAQEAKDGEEASRQRREAMMAEAALNNPFLAAQSAGATHGVLGLDAQFAQMERQGAFKNLPGSGKPLEHGHGSTGHATHLCAADG